MGRIDLHTHSNISDGLLSPWSLVRAAADEGLVAVSVVDHDTVEGTDEALRAGEEFDIELVPGVELSVDNEDGSMHLLGYYIDHCHSGLTRNLLDLKRFREDRNEKIIDRLNELGYRIRLEDVMKLSPEGTYGRAHIAGALVAAGFFRNVSTAFDKLLNRGGPAYIDRRRVRLEEAIELIHDAGGVAVWAHPGTHGEDRMEELLTRLSKWKEFGLDGVESDYCDHTIALRDRLRDLAREHGLIYTGGSDFHGSIKPDNLLGRGPEGSDIDEECLYELKRRVRARIKSCS